VLKAAGYDPTAAHSAASDGTPWTAQRLTDIYLHLANSPRVPFDANVLHSLNSQLTSFVLRDVTCDDEWMIMA
jgi:hypothetical protein